MTSLAHNIEIEDNVRIHSQCFIPEYTIIKKGAWIGPGVFFTNSKYPNQNESKKYLKGPTIEEEAIIGAGSVITSNVSKRSLALTRSFQSEIKNYKRKK